MGFSSSQEEIMVSTDHLSDAFNRRLTDLGTRFRSGTLHLHLVLENKKWLSLS